MRPIAFIPGWAALLCVAFATPALSQDWTVAVDLPISGAFRTNIDDTPIDFDVEKLEGIIFSVTTPYHVGFALEGYSMTVSPGEDKRVGYEAQFINVFVEIPIYGVDWLVFAPGTGWGKGKLFAVDSETDTSTFAEMNLWQFYAVIAVRVSGSFQARLGYHEARTTLVNRDRSQDPLHYSGSPLKTKLTTIGVGYTF